MTPTFAWARRHPPGAPPALFRSRSRVPPRHTRYGRTLLCVQADIDSAGAGLGPKLARAARVGRILAAELAAIIALAPYGAYAMSVYR